MTKIMIVEDDIALREIYSIRLTAEGYTIVVAGDGEEALAKATENSYDMILLDVMLPKMDGFTVCQRIRDFSNVLSLIRLF